MFHSSIVLTECFSLTATSDANGDTTGFVAACGQGIEGCAGYLTGISNARDRYRLYNIDYII